MAKAKGEIESLNKQLEERNEEFTEASLQNDALNEEKKKEEARSANALHDLFYSLERHKAHVEISKELEAESQLEISRLSMQMEDYHRQYFNAINYA